MRVDGLIVSVSEHTEDSSIFQAARRKGIAMTFMGCVVDVNGFSTVVAGDRGGAFVATKHAINIGCGKIGHLAGYQHTSKGRERYRGFEAALRQYGVPMNRRWALEKGFMNIDRTKILTEFILACSFPVTAAVYRADAELGLRIPDDIDIIGLDDGELKRFLPPPISYVEQPAVELGQQTFQLTLESINQQNHNIVQNIVLSRKLVHCKTCVKKVASEKKESARLVAL